MICLACTITGIVVKYDVHIKSTLWSLFFLQNWYQYVSEHKRRFAMFNSTNPYLNDSAFMFDAMWTAALALNKTEARLKKMNLSLKNFSYDDPYNISDIIYEEALNVTFFGLTVSFVKIICMTRVYCRMYNKLAANPPCSCVLHTFTIMLVTS